MSNWLNNANNYWGASADELNKTSYDAQQQKLAYRNALAQMLIRQQMPQGQMVGRQYAGASPWAQGLTAVQNALGVFLAGRNTEAESDLGNKDAALRDRAIRSSMAPAPAAPVAPTEADIQKEIAAQLAGQVWTNPIRSGEATTTAIEPVTPVPVASGGGGRFRGAGGGGSWDVAAEAAQRRGGTPSELRAAAYVPTDRSIPAARLGAAEAAAYRSPATADLTLGPATDATGDRITAQADSAARSAATAKYEQGIDAFKAALKDREQAQRDAVLALGSGSDKSQKLQAALLERSIKPQAEYVTTSTGDGKYVVTNKFTGDVKEGGSNAPARAKPSDINAYRKRESDLRGDIERTQNLVTSASKALQLSKDLDINWAGGAAWEKMFAGLGMNPKYRQLEQVVTQQILPQLTEMKGAASDRDLQAVFNTMPKADANKAEFVAWYVDNQAKLNKALTRLNGDYDAHRQDGIGMGISPVDGQSSSRSDNDYDARWPKRGETVRPTR